MIGIDLGVWGQMCMGEQWIAVEPVPRFAQDCMNLGQLVVRGVAEALPFQDGTVDVIRWLHPDTDALPIYNAVDEGRGPAHRANLPTVTNELGRILREDGQIFVRLPDDELLQVMADTLGLEPIATEIPYIKPRSKSPKRTLSIPGHTFQRNAGATVQNLSSASKPSLSELMDILACPNDGAVLDQRQDSLHCHTCGYVFPVHQGVPTLFPQLYWNYREVDMPTRRSSASEL